MALICPMGHPDGPGQTFCPLCGRGKVQVPDVVAEWEVAPPPPAPTYALAGANVQLLDPPVPLAESVGTSAAWSPLTPPEEPADQEATDQVATEQVARRGRTLRVGRKKSAETAEPVEPAEVAEGTRRSRSARRAEGEEPTRRTRPTRRAKVEQPAAAATPRPFAGITAALAAKPVVGAAVSFLGGAVLAGAAVHGLG